MLSAACSRPTITGATIEPDDDAVAVGEVYTVTCDEHYTMSGSDTMTCDSEEVFDQTPTCEGIQFLVLMITFLVQALIYNGQKRPFSAFLLQY